MNPVFLSHTRPGNGHALQEIFELLRPRLTRMAAYYARQCREEADDLQQEAWLGVFEALPRLNLRIGDPEQYLLKYARWRLLDAVRRSLLRDQPATLDEQFICEDTTHDVPGTLDAASFLARLTPIQQKIVACLTAGLTWRETVDLLDCSSANVAYHVRRIGERYQDWHEKERIAI